MAFLNGLNLKRKFKKESNLFNLNSKHTNVNLHLNSFASLLFPIYFYRPQGSCGKIIFLQLFVILFTGGWRTWWGAGGRGHASHRSMHGREGHVWQGGMHGREVCMAGVMHGRGHA